MSQRAEKNAARSSGDEKGAAQMGGAEKNGAKRQAVPVSTTRIWLEDAWDGWMKQALVALPAVIVGLLYYFGILDERVIGLCIGLGLIVVPLFVAGAQATGLAKSSDQAMMVWGGIGMTGMVAFLFVVGGLFPGQVLFQGELSEAKPDAQLALAADAREIEVYVRGHIDKMGEAGYDLALISPNETQHLTGEVKKHETSAKVGRRRVNGVVAETGEHRFMADLTAPPTKIHVERLDKDLAQLVVEVHRVWLPQLPLTVAAVLLALVAMYLDGRMSGRVTQTYLSIAVGFTLVFGYMYFQTATPSHLVQNAFGAAMIGGIGGTLGGMALSSIGRSLLGQKVSAKK